MEIVRGAGSHHFNAAVHLPVTIHLGRECEGQQALQ